MSVFNWSFEPSSEIPGNLTRPIPSVSTHKSSSEVHSSVRATIPRSPMMDEACQSCRYFGCESTLDTLDTQGPPQDIKCRGLWMAGREPHKGQEGKRTNTLGGLMVDELVARLLWGCWRHLARDPPRGHSSAKQEQKSLCHPKWPREGFWGPPWKHMLQVGVWVFIFPRTLFPSRYPALLCAPSDTAEFSSRV